MGICCSCLAWMFQDLLFQDQEPTPSTADHVSAAGSSNGVMAQQGDALLESKNNDVENMVRVRTEAVEGEENNSGRLEQPVAGASSFGGLVDNTMCHAPGRSVEDSIDNGTGGVAQPGAEASSSGGLRHNPSETRWSYDVFLSFRGEDTRKNFIDHLHSALIQAGIRTFKDDNDLPRGEEISPQLLSAIEGSRISVVVFSRNYASSRWCLDELVKIMKCRQKTPHVVIPIFYHTDPSDVRKQTGSYAKAFDEHEKNFKGEMEKVNRWREALTQAGNLSGWDLNNVANGYEAKFIQKVVKELAEHVAEHPVALLLTGSTRLVGQAFEENRNQIWSWLTDDEVSTIGIYGMGGAGKTTMLKHINNELLQSPDISRHVYWVTVSQNFSVPKLQNKIAKRIQLSFSSEEEELEHRATELSQELMKKQRWILILDDLWNNFELHEVGIPLPLKGCKLIVTTRSEAVCRQMNSKNNVRVKPLSNKEAWKLFMEELGHDTPLSPQVERVARNITRECAGLPLGIKTIAGTMKGVDGMHEWSDALEVLKQSKVPQDEVEAKVFRILRFSYTHLNDEDLQQCFLYCGLFPEDFGIHRENLIHYLIDEGVVKRQKSREAEINKGHTMLDRLERACLLERLYDGDCVKMHDLIRDMAIQILEENSGAIVKAGAQLKELPDAEEWSEKLKSVSLMHNKIKEIHSGHSPRCPNLSTLFLSNNKELGFIADSFFKQLHGLKVLDLSRTNIDSLPDSVSDLEGLTSLLLKDCLRLSSVPSLKKLRALKRLDLSTAPLKKIPRGMKYLSNLRYLRMNGCGENKFPGGILPKLSRLQVFILEEWIIDDGMKFHIYAPVTVEGKEVGCLRKLESLECHFEDQSNYLEYLKSRDGTQSLRTYKISVGQFREANGQKLTRESRIYDHPKRKMVVLGNLNINRDGDFLVISSNDIQQLICECIDAGSIGDVLPLKYSLSSCNSMESLVSSCSAPLPQPSPSYNGIFSALKLLSCYGCKSMKKLFPSVLLPNLVNLQEISVEDCDKMEEIIGGTRLDEEGAMGEENSEFKLPKLRKLILSNLPELKSICSANLICDSLREIKVSKCNSMEIMVPSSWSGLINLDEISVEDCDKMEEIIGGTRSDEEGAMGEESSEFILPKLRKLTLSNLPELKSICSAKLICDSLREIKVSKCNSMEIMVPSSWSGLINLDEISVEDCDKMEEIIGGTRSDEEGAMGEESNEFKLPKLRKLTLSNLPELKSICSAKLICDSLREIKVSKCNSMEIMVPSSWSGLINLEKISVEDCDKMEEIIGGTRSDERVMGKESISSEFKLPKLRELNLVDLPELKSFCNAKLICDSLKLLSCYGCKSMKKLFPSVLLPNLVNLEEIEVDDCEKMEEIIGGTSSDEEGAMGEESNEFKLPKLRSLRLQGLPELKSICSAKLICDSLREIKVSKCNSMEIMVPSSWSGLINLDEISVEDCDKMEEIIGGPRSDEEGAMGEESSEFKLPKLRKMILSNLPELKSISSAKLICNSLKNIDVCKCNSIEILVPSSWSCLLNLEEIFVEECEKMKEIIGGTRSYERVMGKESISSEFKLLKLRELSLVDLLELKSICNAKLICDSLEVIVVLHCEKLKRIPICLPLLENGQPSPPASLKEIKISPKEWWESTVEWEHPNAKDVLRSFVTFLASSSEVHMLLRQALASSSEVHMLLRQALESTSTSESHMVMRRVREQQLELNLKLSSFFKKMEKK